MLSGSRQAAHLLPLLIMTPYGQGDTRSIKPAKDSLMPKNTKVTKASTAARANLNTETLVPWTTLTVGRRAHSDQQRLQSRTRGQG